MPAGISNSAVNPAALTPPRADAQNAQRGAPAAADNQDAQDALAAGGQEVVRAPEAGTGNQRADNDTNTPPERVKASKPDPVVPQHRPHSNCRRRLTKGLGGNVDITV